MRRSTSRAASLDGRTEGAPLNVPLGSIADSVLADVTEQLKSLGLNTDYVATNKLVCTDPNDERLCLAELQAIGSFRRSSPISSRSST